MLHVCIYIHECIFGRPNLYNYSNSTCGCMFDFLQFCTSSYQEQVAEDHADNSGCSLDHTCMLQQRHVTAIPIYTNQTSSSSHPWPMPIKWPWDSHRIKTLYQSLLESSPNPHYMHKSTHWLLLACHEGWCTQGLVLCWFLPRADTQNHADIFTWALTIYT